jgi:hypothetical protein
MSASANLISFIPSEDDVKLAKETKKILAPRLSSTSPFDLRAINPSRSHRSKSLPRLRICSFRFWMR